MKKVLLFLLTVMLGFGSMQLSAQQIVEIPTTGGTSTSSYLPSYSFYNYSLTQQLYTATEIGMPGTISSVAFYNDGDTKTRSYTMYMVNTDKASFSGSNDWITVTAADQVFTGDVTMTGSAWTTITLSTPFFYDGVSNLAIIMDDNTGSYSSGLSCYVFNAPNMALRVYSDGTNYDPMSPGSYSGTVMSTKNHIKLEITPGAITCHHVGTVTASAITSTNATITWNTPEDAGSYMLQYKTSDEDWTGNNVVTMYPSDTTFDFSDMLTPITTYNVRVANLCGNGDTSMWRNTSFTTACAPIDQLPYTEDFDTYGTGSSSYPTCWTKLSTATSNNCPYVSSTNYAGSGSLYFYTGTASTYQIAILPSIDPSLSINTLQLSFVYRANSNSDRLVIGVMDDITDAATFTPVDTVYPLYSAPSAWEHRVVSLANYAGTGSYIAIRNEHTGNNAYAYIDNVEVDVIANCQVPSDLSITNYTSEGADIDWISNGNESAWEVVAVAANADVNTGTPVPASTHPFTLTGLQDNTTYDVYVRSDCGSSEYSGWSVKRTFKTNPACSAPLNVSVSQVTTNSALVTWDDALFGANSYTVGYSQDSLNNWTTQTVTGATQCMLSGLTLNTAYDVFVVSNCAEGTADTVFTSFSTRSCMAGGDPFTEGTSTHSNLPLNNYYNYTYTQQIFLASEMGGAHTLDSIAFDYAYSTPSTEKTSVTIYLGHTTQSTFSSTSNYIPATGLQQVYTGNLNCTQGWNTFVFSTPFQYNGTDNLVLVVDDNSGDYNGFGYYFHVHDAGAPRALYFYDDDINPDLSDPTFDEPSSGTTSSRSNVKFFIPCDNTLTCVAPNPYITEATDNSVTVAWAPGSNETSWELEYTTDSVWVSEGTVSNPHTISGLSDNTDVRIRVRSVCGGSETSGWAGTSARTACSVVNILPLTENFDDVENTGSDNRIYCWSTGSNYSSSYPSLSSSQHNSGGYSVYFYGTSAYYSYLASPEFDASIPVNGLQVRFWVYKTSTPYYIQVGVMSDPNDYSTFEQVSGDITPDATGTWQLKTVNLDQYSGNGHYVAFRVPQSYSSFIYIDDIAIDVIPSCEHVDSLQVLNVTSSGATVAWVPGGNESAWDIAFVPGTGAVDMDTVTFTTVNGTPEYTANDLSQNTPYTVYVRANCGGDYSFWMSTAFMTTQVPATLPYFCDFENAEQANDFGFVNGTQTNQWYVGSATSNGGSNSMYISDNGGTANSYTITSNSVVWAYRDIEFPANPSGYTLSFDWRSYGESCCDYMRVFVGTPTLVSAGTLSEPAGATAMVPNYNSSYANYFNTASSYQTFTTTLPGLAETTVLRLYFLWRNDGSVGTTPPASVDNISVTAIFCDAPTALTVDSVSANTASLSWNSTASSSVLYYKADNDADWTEELSVTSPYQLTNLQANTHYTVRVANNCDDGVSTSPFVVTSFFTDCDIVTTLPYVEYFDNYAASTSTRPNCWAFPVTYSNAPYITANYSSSAPNSLYFQSETTNPTTAVSPQFDADIHTMRVKFMLKAESTTSSGTFEIGVMSDPTDVTTFESVRIIQPANTNWNPYTVDFDSTTMTGQGRYIAFRQNSNSSVWYYWLDNVQFMLIPACMEPANLSVVNVTTTSADLTWTADGSSFNLYYRSVSDTAWTMESNVTLSNDVYTLAGLNPSTSYVWMVSNICNDGSESFSEQASFSTSMEAENLPYSTDFAPGSDVAWLLHNGSCANYWTIGVADTSSALFVTNNGTTPGYSTSSPSIVSAEKLFTVGTTSEFVISFDVLSGGESSWDYMKVFLAPNNTEFPAATTLPDYAATYYSTNAVDFTDYLSNTTGSTDYPYKLNLTNGVLHIETLMPNPISNPDAASTAKLVFVWRNDGSSGTQPGAVIYNVSISAITCPKPTNLTVSNLSMNTADLSWTAGGNETSWIVEYKEASATTWNQATVTTTSYQLTGLTGGTNYEVRVSADCIDETSQYATTSFFTPICPASSTCQYTFVLNDGYGDGWNDGYLTVTQDGATVAILEAVDHEAGGDGSVDTVYVSLCDNSSTALVWTPGDYDDEAGFSIIGPNGTVLFTHDSMDTYTTYTFTTDCSGSGPVVTDPTVATNAASAFTQTTATLNATITNPDNVTITAKGFQWKATNGGTYTSVAGTGTGNTFTANLTNLTPNTSYTFKAFITFNGTTVEGNEMTFTTLEQGVEPCDVPTGLHTTDVQNESIAIAWDANANVNSWNIQYRMQNGTWNSATSNTNSYTITGLTGDKDYEIQVQANCGDGNVSDWSASITAHTTNVGIENWLENNVTLFPNPAREYIDIRVDGDLNVTMMEVYDVYGKRINTVNDIDNPTRINVSGLADGMYFVRVTTEAGVVTKSFVKK